LYNFTIKYQKGEEMDYTLIIISGFVTTLAFIGLIYMNMMGATPES